ncbi:hypothetical protein CKM354_001059300 [Cercospora kikuchii]|uniref:Uncharacterized protein n=1 Tax=Cercospora kikuchii TaxID=84275 RepID=A0A9P3FKP8_9PEZI|nr:uncharacterized protein CKM354_001059300 [Cercospora kikuchii]GIZ47504.1 hypothetical protein CKM354_001059300 [Cercospora kikuchii]
MFSLKSVVVGLTALAVPAWCITADQQAANLKTLTDKSAALIPEANKISATNGPLIIIGQGPYPTIIQGLVDIISTASAHISQQDGSDQVSEGAEADKVYDAYSGFVAKHSDLMSILTTKAGLFTTVPFIGEPVAAVLRQDESVFDAYYFGLSGLVPSKGDEIRTLGESLAKLIITATNAYQGLSTTGGIGRRGSEKRVAKVMVA